MQRAWIICSTAPQDSFQEERARTLLQCARRTLVGATNSEHALVSNFRHWILPVLNSCNNWIFLCWTQLLSGTLTAGPTKSNYLSNGAFSTKYPRNILLGGYHHYSLVIHAYRFQGQSPYCCVAVWVNSAVIFLYFSLLCYHSMHPSNWHYSATWTHSFMLPFYDPCWY